MKNWCLAPLFTPVRSRSGWRRRAPASRSGWDVRPRPRTATRSSCASTAGRQVGGIVEAERDPALIDRPFQLVALLPQPLIPPQRRAFQVERHAIDPPHLLAAGGHRHDRRWIAAVEVHAAGDPAPTLDVGVRRARGESGARRSGRSCGRAAVRTHVSATCTSGETTVTSITGSWRDRRFEPARTP